MRVGVPTEIKNNEARVAITPAGVDALVRRGHEVLVQSGAGLGSRLSDADFAAAGATVVDGPAAVWDAADLLVKVKEPVAEEHAREKAMRIRIPVEYDGEAPRALPGTKD